MDQAIIESPLFKEMMRIAQSPLFKDMVRVAERRAALDKAHEDLLDVLDVRFGEVPAPAAEEIRAVSDTARLRVLLRCAGAAASLDEFTRSLNE